MKKKIAFLLMVIAIVNLTGCTQKLKSAKDTQRSIDPVVETKVVPNNESPQDDDLSVNTTTSGAVEVASSAAIESEDSILPEEPILLTEIEARSMLDERGFDGLALFYNYTEDDEYVNDTEVNSPTEAKHPQYTAFYVNKDDKIFVIKIVQDKLYAIPVDNYGKGVFAIADEKKPILYYEAGIYFFEKESDNYSIYSFGKITAELLDGLSEEDF